VTIRAITFDWGDTLAANYGMPYVETQRRAFLRLADDLRNLGGIIPDAWVDGIQADIAAQWRASIDPAQNPDHREIDMRAMFDGWLRAAGGLDIEPHAMARAMARCTATLTDTVIPFAETRPALGLLKARGYRIGLLSHVPWPGDACRAWFDRHDLGGYFDFFSLSSEVGWIKPNPRHFRHALDQAGCAANEVLHVGDHPVRDIQGAKAFGMRTCLRHTENIHAPDALAACAPDAEIVRLSELSEVLKQLDAQ